MIFESAESQDWTKILPIVLSAIAVLISIAVATLAAYNQYYKPSRLEVVVSEKLRAWLGAEGELVMAFGVAIINSGATYDVITKLSIQLDDSALPQPLVLTWRMFLQHKNVGDEGVSFDPHGAFSGWADYLVVPARQAVANHILFFSQTPWPPRAGTYTLRLSGHAGDRLVRGAQTSFKVALDEATASKLATCRVDPQTRITKRSIVLSRIRQPGKP
jgi:hypothetical protein